MEEFLKKLSALDWVVIYVLAVLFAANAALRIVGRLQRIRLKRLELKKHRLEQIIHPGGICPAIERIGEVIPDMCPHCARLLKWIVTKE